MEVTGTIKDIFKTEIVGNNGFRKRDIIITTNEQYPQTLSIQFVQDKCDILNNYKIGDGVKIGINLRGREWTNPQGETKYFNTIQGWKIEDHGASVPTQSYDATPVQQFEDDSDDDDLPF